MPVPRVELKASSYLVYNYGMVMWSKLSLTLIIILSVITLVTPMLVIAQTPTTYVSPEGKMGTHFNLTVFSPNNQTTYANTMPLNFNLQWLYDIIPVGNYQLSFEYDYKVDDGPFVSITSNQSSTDFHAGGTNLTTNPTFSYLVNISDLTNGYHEIQIKASFIYAWQYSATYPVYFLVQNPSSNPTPRVPEFPLIAIPLLISMLTVVAVILTQKKPKNML